MNKEILNFSPEDEHTEVAPGSVVKPLEKMPWNEVQMTVSVIGEERLREELLCVAARKNSLRILREEIKTDYEKIAMGPIPTVIQNALSRKEEEINKLEKMLLSRRQTIESKKQQDKTSDTIKKIDEI